MACVDVALLPDHVDIDALETQCVIVIDVLRASTTMIAAVESGAESIQPIADVQDARDVAQNNPEVLLCGERHGVPPDGFVIGNSPLEYEPSVVAGKRLVLTTTNGTRALSMVGHAKKILIGGLTNRASACIELGSQDVLIVCAGTEGRVSLDDSFTAGMMVQWLTQQAGYDATETAQIACQSAEWLLLKHRSCEQVLKSTLYGRRLIDLGMDRDIEYAAQLDSSEAVPVLDLPSNTITAG
ncbi:MAG: 2-phosphosulfolactate phosphatase [Phycisphaerales bacterium]|nr:2-phosphosulfolactate phosphatase [Phycisphaerales bacterium]